MMRTIHGTIVRGKGRGDVLGIRTANVLADDQVLHLQGGIYAARIVVRGAEHIAAVSIGANVTFNETIRTIEAHIIDFSENILGEHVTLTLVARLRSMKRFATTDDLKAAIAEDIILVRKMMK